MPDNKYGRLFTTSDLVKIMEYVVGPDTAEADLYDTLRVMDSDGVRFKFEDHDEPLFVLRGHDRRAIGAVMHYQQHQSPTAPPNHLDAIGKAVRAFDDYRTTHAARMREPD